MPKFENFLVENREISWLKFNERVLHEAFDTYNPLLEQLRFYAIFFSNLEEFYMVRVARLRYFNSRNKTIYDTLTGEPSEKVLRQVKHYTNNLIINADYLYKSLKETKDFRTDDYGLFSYKKLTPSEKSKVDTYFLDSLLPNIKMYTTKDPSFKNKRLYFSAIRKNKTISYFSVKETVPRIFEFSPNKFILLESIIENHINQLFSEEILYILPFKVIRSQISKLVYREDTELSTIDGDISLNIEKRKKGLVTYIQIKATENQNHIAVINDIKGILTIDDIEVHEFYYAPVDTSFLFQYISKISKTQPQLVFNESLPVDSPTINKELDIFSQIDQEEKLVFFPFESFETSFIKFLSDAANNLDCEEIYITIYRLAKNSEILNCLKLATKNGIKVKIILEFKARFDEEHNLEIARMLEPLGDKVEIITSRQKFKVHAKLSLVKFKNGRLYSYIGTGNLHEQNAKIYTDIGYFTNKTEIGLDIMRFFNGVKESVDRVYLSELVASPISSYELFSQKIKREMTNQALFNNGYIILKINALYNSQIIADLITAAKAGVKIDIICRGYCGLIPAINPETLNIRVVSLIGRYLEHGRFFYFHNNDNPDLYIGSCDFLDRNFFERYEIIAPIKNPILIAKIFKYSQLLLTDTKNSHILTKNKTYQKVNYSDDEKAIDSQNDFIKLMYGGTDNE